MSLSFLNATFNVVLGYTVKGPVTGSLLPARDVQNINLSDSFLTGVGAGQANQLYCFTRTLAPSASENLALYGSLVDNLGNVINFTKIKAIAVALLNTTAASSLTIGGAAANSWVGPWSALGTETIANGGVYLNANPSATGWTVTATNVLKVLNNDAVNSATYLIFLLGN